MRIFPLILIGVGVYGVLNHYGLIDPSLLPLFWPVLLIAIGLAMLLRGPRWRADMHERMQDRWERRMNRRFGPGWANLSEEERERFRAGMRQWRGHGCGPGSASGQWTADSGAAAPASSPASTPSSSQYSSGAASASDPSSTGFSSSSSSSSKP